MCIYQVTKYEDWDICFVISLNKQVKTKSKGNIAVIDIKFLTFIISKDAWKK